MIESLSCNAQSILSKLLSIKTWCSCLEPWDLFMKLSQYPSITHKWHQPTNYSKYCKGWKSVKSFLNGFRG